MALTQIKLGGLAAESVDSDAYVDGSIDNAHLAGGTDGNIISYDASGDPVAIATGSDGQVLTSTGAGSPPAFENLNNSIEMFYPVDRDSATATRYSNYRTGKDIDDNEDVSCSGVAPAGFTGISNMYVMMFFEQGANSIDLRWTWQMAADNTALSTHEGSDLAVTAVNAIGAAATDRLYKKTIFNEANNGADFEDLIAANDVFGCKFKQAGADNTYVMGMSIVWTF